jgi:N-glycosidase YbiA
MRLAYYALGRMTIFFYKVCEPYGWFSNFSPHSIDLDGYHWPTSEHYYQAQKFVGTSCQYLYPKINTAPSPEAAAAIGRNPNYSVRGDWEIVKKDVMYIAVLTKFLTYPYLKQLLIETGDDLIVENSPTDSYWGCGLDGKGQNQLGKVLMRVREELCKA